MFFSLGQTKFLESKPPQPEEPRDLLFVPQASAMRHGSASLDEENLDSVFEVRASLMRTVPKFMRGAFRGVSKTSLQAILHGCERKDIEAETRDWKLFLLTPRLFLARAPRWGVVPQRAVERERESNPIQRRRVGIFVGIVIGTLSAGSVRTMHTPTNYRPWQVERWGWHRWASCPTLVRLSKALRCSRFRGYVDSTN